MIESYCRPYCQRFFIDPPAKILARLPYLLPNHISIGAMLLGLRKRAFLKSPIASSRQN